MKYGALSFMSSYNDNAKCPLPLSFTQINYLTFKCLSQDLKSN